MASSAGRDQGRRAHHPAQLFKNRTFTATSGVGFIIGFAMFGAIIYLPLYLQVVHGVSPDRSRASSFCR